MKTYLKYYILNKSSSSWDYIILDGVCNTKDKKVWTTKNTEAKKAFKKWEESCVGRNNCPNCCTAQLMNMKEGFSQQCSNCFGFFAGCATSKCNWDCRFKRYQDDCNKCVKRYCVKPFMKCSGLSSPICSSPQKWWLCRGQFWYCAASGNVSEIVLLQAIALILCRYIAGYLIAIIEFILNTQSFPVVVT